VRTKVIKCNLSARSFYNAAKEIRAYADELDRKCHLFVSKMAEIGYEEIVSILAAHVYTGETLGSVTILEDGSEGSGRYKARVIVSSDAILFLEFGSGTVGLAGEHNPLEGEYGMGAGTYPSEAPRQNPDYANWENPEGWVYYDAYGKKKRTKGMEASMPMYRGGQEMERQLERVAERIFR